MNAGAVDFPYGSLTPEQLASAFAALPADITIVDADNVVRYYSEYRIFSRTPACLDQDVLECHSPATRPGIARLLAELRDGWREEAVFLESKDGRPVSVAYRAIRDSDGGYLGMMEIAQWADAQAAEG